MFDDLSIVGPASVLVAWQEYCPLCESWAESNTSWLIATSPLIVLCVAFSGMLFLYHEMEGTGKPLAWQVRLSLLPAIAVTRDLGVRMS